MSTDKKIFFAIVILGILFDQISKKAMLSFLSGQQLYAGNLLGLEIYKNFGIAFGVPAPAGIFYLLVLIFLLASARAKIFEPEKFSRSEIIAFSLIFSGALSNMFDRVSMGYIIDFISIKQLLFFNFADVMIAVGALMILRSILYNGKSLTEINKI